MRFWLSIGPLVLALGILALPAHAADKKKQQEAAKPAATAPAPTTAAPAATTTSAKPKKASAPNAGVSERRSWMIGFDYGLGSGSFKGTGEAAFAELGPDGFSTSSREWGKVTQFRFGYAIRPSLAVSFSRSTWKKTLNGDDWKIGITAINYTWYPKAGQFYLRGGFGVGDASDKDVLDQTTGQNVLRTDDGLGLTGAVGYEWPVWKRMSLSPQFEAGYMSLDNKVSASMMNFTVAVNWWF